jgi:hypothetical protein
MAETDWSLLGMQLVPPEDSDNDLEQPLEAVTIVKGFDANGNIAWWLASTPDLNAMEKIGMLHWALGKIET